VRPTAKARGKADSEHSAHMHAPQRAELNEMPCSFSHAFVCQASNLHRSLPQVIKSPWQLARVTVNPARVSNCSERNLLFTFSPLLPSSCWGSLFCVEQQPGHKHSQPATFAFRIGGLAIIAMEPSRGCDPCLYYILTRIARSIPLSFRAMSAHVHKYVLRSIF
jgi:hypothetical protein